VSSICDLIHGAIDAGSVNTLPDHQGVQELHMVSGGSKHQCWLALFNGFSDQPQQSSNLVFSSAKSSSMVCGKVAWHDYVGLCARSQCWLHE